MLSRDGFFHRVEDSAHKFSSVALRDALHHDAVSDGRAEEVVEAHVHWRGQERRVCEIRRGGVQNDVAQLRGQERGLLAEGLVVRHRVAVRLLVGKGVAPAQQRGRRRARRPRRVVLLVLAEFGDV